MLFAINITRGLCIQLSMFHATCGINQNASIRPIPFVTSKYNNYMLYGRTGSGDGRIAEQNTKQTFVLQMRTTK